MNEIEKRLFSAENIYLALYSVESYIQNRELLVESDKIELAMLKDKFNVAKMEQFIKSIQERLHKIMEDNDYLQATVYFKPKKYDEDKKKVIFRPIHTSPLKDQITAIAMLNILIYDQDEEGHIKKSNLSRLIPHNFYGNRIAFEPEKLYKTWTEQYKEYTRKSNEYYKQFRKSMAYKWEINLDIKNFFPSVHPYALMSYIDQLLPVTYSKEERNYIHKILERLLFVELQGMTEEDIQLYTNISSINNCRFALGLPQGLPQSYFFANIIMMGIEKIYAKNIPGKMLFYVDDSVIFTNSISGTMDFDDKIKSINKDIEMWVEDLIKLDNINLSNEVRNHIAQITKMNEEVFKITIHEVGEKSTLSNIQKSREGESYIHCVGREVSKTAFEMNTGFSDEEDEILRKKTKEILKAIDKEISSIQKDIDNLEKFKEKDDEEEKGLLAYKKKLIRSKKFFKNRNKDLVFRQTTDANKLEKELLKDLKFVKNKNDTESLISFFESYNEDTLSTRMIVTLKAMRDQNYSCREIIKNLLLLDSKLFQNSGIEKNVNNQHSFIYKTIEEYQKNESDISDLEEIQMNCHMYSTLVVKINWKFRYMRRKADIVGKEEVKKQIENQLTLDDIVEKYISQEFSEMSKLVWRNSLKLQRMILNAIFSCLLKFEINDDVILHKKDNRKITYFEFRLLEILRNRNFSSEDWSFIATHLLKELYSQQTIDYTIMQVIGIFKTYINIPMYIDNLILVHKYTCDIWKNGSKYLYFYTLHNQEHAIDLIQNSIKILRAIDFIGISRNDYYVLFIACYLHDISMVTLPDLNKLQHGGYETDKIYSDFVKEIKNISPHSKKEILKLLKDYYMRIDSFYENLVRSNHAKDSASEIRNRTELNFIDASLREIIAEVSEAHGYNVEDIYKIKSDASSKMWSKKFTKITLRLADLLDMSSYRVSRVILDHNLDNMNEVSRFHWLSHLLTERYELTTEYSLDEGRKKNFLERGSLTENIILTVYVNISQITGDTGGKCVEKKLLAIDKKGMEIECGPEKACEGSKCNFLCKWFGKKNEYLFLELAALKGYLNELSENYYTSKVTVRVKYEKENILSPQQFTALQKFIAK